MKSSLLCVCLLTGVLFLTEATPINKEVLLKRLLRVLEKRSDPPSCTAKYKELKASTMCQYWDSPNARDKGVSSSDRQVIVDEHNSYRSKVNPTATDMQKMYWDDEIAVIAQKWADTCRGGHDTNDNRKVPGYNIWIGQNWASGYSSWSVAIREWHNEVSLYRYGEDPNNYLSGGYAAIGHYTQMVRDIAARVGCGYVRCPSGPYYVCNYAYGNPSDWGRPYESGKTCAKCPNTCNNNLCDCRGKICYNGGKVDPNTCQCKCTGIYGGDKCDKIDCPAADEPYCGNYYPKSYCTRYINVPTECPYMCGLCKEGENNNNNNNQNDNDGNSGKNSKSGSGSNSGSNGGKTTCTQLFDADWCEWASASDCRKYSNYPTDCPIMCDKCTAKCPGKGRHYCQNGGTLQEDCTCSCTNKWKGDKCQYLVNCPSGDKAPCGTQWPVSYCKMYTNVPEDCPFMCGLCQGEPERCPGKGKDYCGQKGKLDENCQCKCTEGYNGDRCQNKLQPETKCPTDVWWCKYYGTEYCTNDWMTASCKQKCGKC